jgi:hypothetical protein
MPNRPLTPKEYADQMKSRFINEVQKAGISPNNKTIRNIMTELKKPITCQQ